MAGANVWIKSGTVRNLFPEPGVVSGGNLTGAWLYKDSPMSTFQANVVGTGAVSAVVVIEYSNDGVNAVSTVGGTITLSGTTTSSDGFTSNAPWKFVRARLTDNPSGTGATVQVWMGV